MPPLLARPSSSCLRGAAASRPRPLRPLPTLRAPRSNYAPRAANEFFERNSVRHDLQNKHPKTPKRPLFTSVRYKLEKLKAEFLDPAFLQSLHLTREDFDREWLNFERSVNLWTKQATPELIALAHEAGRGKNTLEVRLRYLFYAQTCGGRFTTAELDNQRKVADLQHPDEWYPATREISRTIHLHVGPTNSGKTYHALKRLEEVESGIYLGPLRLLAHEVYTRLNAKGKSCALITGDEQRLPETNKPTMFSCTVEMAPLNTHFDVAVIDEIQMINSKERGWAWTSAFLGLKAKEIHLCGEARSVPIMRELCALVGDKVQVHEYKRLTPLELAPKTLRGKLTKLEKGDCIVSFSVLSIHALRQEIEKKTGKKCAIVYGSLPPETRAQQARLFNDPDNDYDYLVASDAIGMGLNLAIKRVIFESTLKSNGVNLVPLAISEIKQIAGRAGRYKTAHHAITNHQSKRSITDVSADTSMITRKDGRKKAETKTIGYATTLEDIDYQFLKKAMNQEPEPIRTAGLSPPPIIIERFASYFPPGTPFSYILLRLNEISTTHSRFHLCSLRDQLAIADAIHMVQNLSVADRLVLCDTPARMTDQGERQFLQTLASCIADGKSGNLLDLDHLPLEVLDEKPERGRTYLRKLEQLHKMLVCYLWLSYRFPNVFVTRSLAEHTKQLTEDAIEHALTTFSFTPKTRQIIVGRREKAFRRAFGFGMENKTSAMEGQQIPPSTTMSEEAVAILKDSNSFASGPPPRDDLGEYPEEPEPNKSRARGTA